MTSSRLRWCSVLLLWLGQSRQSQRYRVGDGSIEVKQAIERIEHLLVTYEFSDRRQTTRKLRVMDLRDGDTTTVHNLLAYRKVANAPNL